jgi:(E)-4-hydroxy-3-methylbut-2-enyl-diphosphate synthase
VINWGTRTAHDLRRHPVPRPRKSTIPVTLGGVVIGGDAPIVVQSMTNTVIGMVAAGLFLSLSLDTPGGPSIVLVLAGLFAATIFPSVLRRR